MTMIRPETEMKESGASWMGKIPCEWSVSKLKWYLRRIDPRNPGDKQVLSLYREYGVIPKDSRDDNHNATSEDTSKYKYVRVGDFVVNKMKAWQGSVAVSEYDGIVSPAYYVYHFTDDSYHRRYFHYLLRSCYKEEFMRLSGGIRVGQWDLSSKDLDNVLIVIPKKEEQQAIADYLDETCSQIDEIIAEAKASIDEYKELKQSVIFEAVTKGLDKNVEMKSTSVGWIGTVPSHWRVAKIRQVAEFYNGDRSSKYPSGDDIVSEGIMFITSNNLGYIVLNTNISTNKFITKQKYDDLGGAKLRINDIVFCLRGSVGKCAINKTFDEGTIASSLVVIRAKKVDADYLNYVLQNHRITDEAIVNAIGIGSLNLAAHDISEFYMPIPPEREMQDIVRYLDDKVGNVDDLISEKESLIHDLEAYKKSLIYEVVTGKRRVV